MAARWLPPPLLICTLSLALVAMLIACRDLSWNLSDSMPPGIWRLVDPFFDTAKGKGQVVRFCPPASAVFLEAKARGYIPTGRCPGGLAPLLKPVVAVPGDVVAIGADVRVNGVKIAGSERLAADGQGRRLPVPLGGVVPEGYVWMVSSYDARSFDSRYFGKVATATIEGVMVPYWIWSNE